MVFRPANIYLFISRAITTDFHSFSATNNCFNSFIKGSPKRADHLGSSKIPFCIEKINVAIKTHFFVGESTRLTNFVIFFISTFNSGILITPFLYFIVLAIAAASSSFIPAANSCFFIPSLFFFRCSGTLPFPLYVAVPSCLGMNFGFSAR